MRSIVRVCCSRARCGTVVVVVAVVVVNGWVMGWVIVSVCGRET
jgi:hypothetical protein